MIEVCAAVVVRGDQVLVARRARPAELVGKWEFPGGKLEAGESPQECLVRELREELAYDVTVGGSLGQSERLAVATAGSGADEVETPKLRADLRLTAYSARPVADADEPALIDGTHDKLRWVTADQLLSIDLAPLDVPLVDGVLRLLENHDAHLR